jgi:hypothetical protein
MRIANLADFLVRTYENPQARMHTTFIRGASGIGKSDSIKQASAILSARYGDEWAGFVDLRLSQCDITDLRGVPSVVDKRTVWNMPEFFPKPNTRGIFFMDEITSAPPAMQAVAYQLALDRLHLPEGWMVVAAGNKQSDRGVTFTMAAPLVARMCLIDVDPELDGFLSYAALHKARPEIMAFIAERPDMLHNFDAKVAGEPFPNPRSWMRASVHLDLALEPAERVEVLQGDVGKEAAALFEAFLRVWETMPKLSQIFEDPDSVEVPERLDVKHCVVMGLAAMIDEKNFDNAYKFLARLPKEMQTLCVRLAHRRNPAISKTQGYVKWAVNNQDVWKRSA